VEVQQDDAGNIAVDVRECFGAAADGHYFESASLHRVLSRGADIIIVVDN
jgi:hypothetical protein